MNEAEALSKLQNTLFEMLLVFSEYCKKNDIEWFLDSGSALGAKRHGGFIPWDDDVDVAMLRSDYDRLMECSKVDFPKGFSVRTMKNTPGYTPCFAKMYKENTKFYTEMTIDANCDQQIYIDIFVYDYLASDLKERKKQVSNARFWQRLSYLKSQHLIEVPGSGLIGEIEKFGFRLLHYPVSFLFTQNQIQNKYDNSIIRDEKKLSEDTMCLAWPLSGVFPVEVLVPTQKLFFNGVELPVPRDVEKYLEIMYGDWKIVPPLEERHTHLPLELVFDDGLSWKKEQV